MQKICTEVIKVLEFKDLFDFSNIEDNENVFKDAFFDESRFEEP